MSPAAVPVGPLGLGAAQAGNLGRPVSDQDFDEAFATMWAGGVRYLDTAPHYGLGLSERRCARALATVPRDEVLVSTKVGRLLDPTPERADEPDDEGFAVPATHRRRFDFSRDGILRSIEESLDRLGLDRLDVVYLHDPDAHWDQAAREGVPALTELRDQGVVLAVGAGMNQSAMLTRFIAETDIDIVMCAGRYTLLEQPAAADLLPLAQQKGVSVVLAGVYNSGLLAGRPRAGASYDYAPAEAAVLARATAISDVCHRHGTSLPQAALAFSAAHPGVSSLVVGVRDGVQAAQTLAWTADPPPAALWDELVELGLLDPALPLPVPTDPQHSTRQKEN